jgi:hypothetical protein
MCGHSWTTVGGSQKRLFRKSKQDRITELHYWLKTRIKGKSLILVITDNAVHNIARIVEKFLRLKTLHFFK